MKPFIVVSCLGALLLGCANTPTTPPIVVECTQDPGGTRGGPALVGVPYGMRASAIPLDSVQFDNAVSARQVAVQGLFASRLATETVQLDVRLVSCSDQMRTLRARTSFMRANGAPAEPPSAWQTIVVHPRALATYRERSIATDVHHYVVELQRER